jgi:DNA-binding winged helix-turn-helix (wHTH) protein
LEIWQALTPLEHKCLTSEKPCEHATPLYLDTVGLCKKGEITIPLFAAFVKEKAKELQTTASSIVYHADTNTITKGELVLSENLTISEFRLLRFLLQNSNRVVEKEEIIAAVWKDAKSTAGVTDQALDQLLFRLRKKIEDDPNNPSHIQTIKGRGIKFIS